MNSFVTGFLCVCIDSAMLTDYYSEDVTCVASEEEILEYVPPVKSINTDSLSLTANEDANNENLIIEDERNALDKSKELNLDFESKIKRSLLLKSTNSLDNSSKEFKKKDRILRFKILENELRSLMVEIDQDKAEDELPLKLKIDSLLREIGQSNINASDPTDKIMEYWDHKLLGIEIPSTKTELPDTLAVSQKETNKEFNAALKVIELESRISKLEESVGNFDIFDDSPSLHDIIQDLYLRTNLILDGGKSISTVEKEINGLIENCEKYIKNSKKIRDKSEIVPLTDLKINLLFRKVKSLPEFSPILDKILAKFKSLNSLIFSMTSAVDFMEGLSCELHNLELKLDSWDLKLDQLESQLEMDRAKLDKHIQDVSKERKDI